MKPALAERPLIAIVDDDAPLLSALGNLLRSADYRVALFDHAEACLSGVVGLNVDLVLSDYRMSGESGVDLMKALRARGCGAPTIIMTAQPSDELEELAISAGASAVLSKPFDELDLLSAMEAAIGGRAARLSAEPAS